MKTKVKIYDDETSKLLDEELKEELRCLGKTPTGSQEYDAAVENIVKLYKLKTEEQKARDESAFKYARLVLDGAGIALPLIFCGCWMKRGFKFEETGSITSLTFRNLFSRCFRIFR